MKERFAASEAVEMGIEIEKNGRDFYDTLAGKARDQEAFRLFKWLAKQETKHIRAFKRILAIEGQLPGVDSAGGEYTDYLNSLVREQVFVNRGKGREIAAAVKSGNSGLEMAIGFENDSIVFYEGIREAVASGGKKILEALIKEEKEHLKRLDRLKKKKS